MDPRGFLNQFSGGTILYEAQRCPALFSYLQTRVDERQQPGEFILTGSQQFGLLSDITQSLAGRATLLTLLPMSYCELHRSGKMGKNLDKILFDGAFPPSSTADSIRTPGMETMYELTWISVLEASYIVALLPPHHQNFNKRLVKTPKLYFLDTGLATWLLSNQNSEQLSTHVQRGALFATWVISELLKAR